MQIPSFKEDPIFQISALQMLTKLGWQYLSPKKPLDIGMADIGYLGFSGRSSGREYFLSENVVKNGQATKAEIDGLLLDKLPAILDEHQQRNKIRNLIYALSKKEQRIENQGTNRYPVWKLVAVK